ncbi:Bug family tripartite tricarboxylate transporter substrate binding protein [Serratia marcescens]
MNHIPYKGSAPGLTDLMGGQVDTMCDVSMALTHVRAGKLKLLAVGAPTRLAAFPDVPTMAELGYPQANFSAWYGVVVPHGTPSQIQGQINATVNKALKTSRALSMLASMDALPVGGSSAEFRRTIEADSANIQQVVRSKGIRVEQ